MLHVMNIFKRIVVREMRDKSNMKSFIALGDLREKIYICKSGYAAIAQSGSIKLDLKKSEASAITKLLYNAERRKYTDYMVTVRLRKKIQSAFSETLLIEAGDTTEVSESAKIADLADRGPIAKDRQMVQASKTKARSANVKVPIRKK